MKKLKTDRPNCGWKNHRNEAGKYIRGGQCARCDEYICPRCEGTGTTYLGASWAMEPGPCSCIYDD